MNPSDLSPAEHELGRAIARLVDAAPEEIEAPGCVIVLAMLIGKVIVESCEDAGGRAELTLGALDVIRAVIDDNDEPQGAQQ